MRLYRIETLTTYITGHEEVFETIALIVPESALSSYEFHACEYIGDLAVEFELIKRGTESPPSQENKVVKLEKKNKPKSKNNDDK